MVTKVFKCFTLSAMVATMFIGSACQKNTDYEMEELVADLNDSSIVFSNGRQCISKKIVKKKLGFVYVEDTWGNMIKHKTVKIKSPDGKLVQEWLYEDLKVDVGCNYYYHEDDSTGDKYGFYYRWEGFLSDISYSDWSSIVYADENGENPIPGFHLPDPYDIKKLDDIVGKNNVAKNLNITCDSKGGISIKFSFLRNTASLWINDQSNPNRVPGCGVMMCWDFAEDPMHGVYGFTNMPVLCANVRLVRDINKEQW